MTVDELKTYIDTNETDSVLVGKLQALELLVRQYTNNNFQVRSIRFAAVSENGKIRIASPLLKAGDTVQISQSKYNDGVYLITAKDGDILSLSDDLIDGDKFIVTKVKYPQDVKIGVINMLKWDISNRAKVGIQSETISRHSVTYFNLDGDNSIMGYPKSLMGFLKPYMKARF